MHTVLAHNFIKDLASIRDTIALKRIQKAMQAIGVATTLADVPNCRKMQGNIANAYRIRVGDYRIGLYIFEDGTAELAYVRHRRDIYKVFP